jgi:uncharacterized protein (DUF305 family)
MMVPHHEGALEMARIAEERAERPEIRAMAADILRTQAAEIAQMKAWRQAWFGSDLTPPMSEMPMVEGMQMRPGQGHAHAGEGGPAPTMNMAADVEALRATDAAFDLAFVEVMIPHHQDAVDASRAALERASRPEIKQLAAAIIASQTREITLMQGWKLSWSGAPGTHQMNTGQPDMGPGLKDEHAEEH